MRSITLLGGFELNAIVARYFGIYRGNTGFGHWKALRAKPWESLKTLRGHATCADVENLSQRAILQETAEQE